MPGRVMSVRDAYVLMRDRLRELADERVEPAAATSGTDQRGGSAALPSAAAMVSEGEVIRIEFEGRTIRLKRSKGLVDLSRLLAEPGRELAAVDLMEAGVVASAAEPERIDRLARQQYEDRVRELVAEIEQAERSNDTGTVERLRLELDLIVDELTRSTGLGGRSRTASAPAEKARSAVTQRVRGSIKRIADHDERLGRHLDTSVTTGLYCRYEADITWRVDVDHP